MVEAGEVACPNEFFLALFVEVDAIGYVVVYFGRGKGLLHGEVGYLALCEVVYHPSWVCGCAQACFGVDSSHGHHSVEQGGQGVDYFACVAFHCHMGRVYVGMGFFEP